MCRLLQESQCADTDATSAEGCTNTDITTASLELPQDTVRSSHDTAGISNIPSAVDVSAGKDSVVQQNNQLAAGSAVFACVLFVAIYCLLS